MWDTLMSAQALTDETFVTRVTHLVDHMTVHSFEYKVTGTGTVVIRAYTSISGAYWINNGIKANGVGASSGPDGDGQDVIPMRLKPGELIRFSIVATGTVGVTLWFAQK